MPSAIQGEVTAVASEVTRRAVESEPGEGTARWLFSTAFVPKVRAAGQVVQSPSRIRIKGMRRIGLLLAVLFVSAACSQAAAITEDQEFWCRTSQEALSFDYFAQTFEELHGVSMIEAKAEFGYKESAGEQVGSRMTITERGGFPDIESQEAWYSSERFVDACALVYDEKA